MKLEVFLAFSCRFYIYIYSIKNLQDELPITIPTNYSTKHCKDDNTTGQKNFRFLLKQRNFCEWCTPGLRDFLLRDSAHVQSYFKLANPKSHKSYEFKRNRESSVAPSLFDNR